METGQQFEVMTTLTMKPGCVSGDKVSTTKQNLFIYFFKQFLTDRSHFCGASDTPVLVTSHLGFKAKVGSLIHAWWRHMCYTFTETFGTTPADLLVASMAV